MALKKSQKSLKSWTDQKWMTSGTHSNLKKGKNKEVKSKGSKRYLPKAAWETPKLKGSSPVTADVK